MELFFSPFKFGWEDHSLQLFFARIVRASYLRMAAKLREWFIDVKIWLMICDLPYHLRVSLRLSHSLQTLTIVKRLIEVFAWSGNVCSFLTMELHAWPLNADVHGIARVIELILWITLWSVSVTLRIMQRGRLSLIEGSFFSNEVVPLCGKSLRELNFIQGVALRRLHCVSAERTPCTFQLRKHVRRSTNGPTRGDMSYLSGVVSNRQQQRWQHVKVCWCGRRRSFNLAVCLQWYSIINPFSNPILFSSLILRFMLCS